MPRVILPALLALAAATSWPAGARAARSAPAPENALRCMGASTMSGVVAAWMRATRARYPAARYQLVGGSRFSAAGVQSALRGRVDCVTFAREPFPSEVRAYRARFGAGPVVIPVAQGSYRTPHGTFALAVYVNRKNPLRRLTLRQLRRILGPGSGAGPAVLTWGDLGAQGAWRKRPLHVYGMQPLRATGNPPGIVNFLEHRVLHGAHWRGDLRVRADTPGTSALAAIVRAVAQDPDGIGYSGIGYATPSVATIALSRDMDGPYYLPTPDNVAWARYPLSRRIYLGFNPNLSRRARNAACRLLSVALGERGRPLLAADRMRFLPLTEAQTRESVRLAHRELGCPSGTFGGHAKASPADKQAAGRGRSADLTIVGYNDMAAVFRSWNGAFARLHPGVRFRVQLHGTRTAPMALARGRSQLAPMGAPFSPHQLQAYRTLQKADPVGFRVAHASVDPRARSSPIAIYVHPSNPVRRVTLQQLRQVLGRNPPGPRPTWGRLGARGDWASRRIMPCGLAPSTALGRYMIDHVLGGGGFATDYLAFSESGSAVHEAAVDRSALCFGDLNDAAAKARRLGIAVDDGRRVFTGTRAEIHSGAYPLDRFLYIYVRRHAGASSGGTLICRYMEMVLSARGQVLLAATAPGYIPLNAREIASERRRLGAAGCTTAKPPRQHERP